MLKCIYLHSANNKKTVERTPSYQNINISNFLYFGNVIRSKFGPDIYGTTFIFTNNIIKHIFKMDFQLKTIKICYISVLELKNMQIRISGIFILIC